MALINCPECGKQISSSAKQCVHCGCAFSVCPECGNVTVGSFEVCPSCGYSSAKPERPQRYEQTQKSESFFDAEPAPRESAAAIVEDPLRVWQKSSPVDRYMMKSFKWLKILFHVLSFVFFILGSVFFIIWMQKSSIEQAYEAEQLITLLRCVIGLVCSFEIIDILFDPIKESFVKLRCGNWINRKKLDAVTYLKQHCGETGFGEDIDNFDLFAEATYLSKNSGSRTTVIVGMVVRFVCAVAMFIFIGYAVMQNLAMAMIVAMLGIDFQFRFIMLIPAGIVGLIWFVSTVVIDSVYDKKNKAWFNKNVTKRTIFV